MKPRDQSLNNFTEKIVRNQPRGKPIPRFGFLQQQSGRTTSAIKTRLITCMRTIPNNHSPFFRAAIKTNPYSQIFITAVKKQKIFAHSLFSLSLSLSLSLLRARGVKRKEIYAMFDWTSANNH